MWFKVHNWFLDMIAATNPGLAALFIAAGMPEETWIYIP